MAIGSALIVAQRMVDSGRYRETDGPNRSEAIDHLANEFDTPLGSSWCALFVSHAFKTVEPNYHEGLEFYYTAGSQALLAWFKKHGLISSNVEDLHKWKGALIIRTDPGGQHGHVAFVKNRLTNSDNKIKAISTLEGNTNSAGGANGDGAYERKRIIPLTPYVWTYCNTTPIKGGKWWS